MPPKMVKPHTVAEVSFVRCISFPLFIYKGANLSFVSKKARGIRVNTLKRVEGDVKQTHNVLYAGGMSNGYNSVIYGMAKILSRNTKIMLRGELKKELK